GYLVIRCLHLGGGPWLQHRVAPVAHSHSDLLPGAVIVAVVRKRGIIADRATQAGRWIAPFAAAEPGETYRGELGSLAGSLSPGWRINGRRRQRGSDCHYHPACASVDRETVDCRCKPQHGIHPPGGRSSH